MAVSPIEWYEKRLPLSVYDVRGIVLQLAEFGNFQMKFSILLRGLVALALANFFNVNGCISPD